MNLQAFETAVKYADDLNDEYAENNDFGYSMNWTEIGPILVKKYLELIDQPDTLHELALKVTCTAITKLDYDYEQTTADFLTLYLELVENGS